ncbi:Crp/Fnr family transcriptional regulator [Streptosporangium sp. NBC_01756]|uniref:Crp/Fnr family transcriptional regulator n=1 Tax=Streptosporangium sp. NBC_01756 TaxID=2975950 RepID=UPI002DDAD7A6|nr:Crp/Fnr family transcriptional regulator [Streptosporangium sp. NBC_01756]WSC86464.1 Crp/Fnr family transcriptional regulator [Streptosporangium sp. NBC_01756]
MGVVRTYPTDYVIVRQGDSGNLVFVVMHGLVKVTARTENGRQSLLAVRVRGDVIGDMAVLDGSTRSATAIACGTAVTRLIRGEVFLDYLRRHPSAAVTLSTLMGDRLRWANQRRLEFAGYDSGVCLARLLLAVVARHGRPGPEGTDLGVPLTQIELGGLIGAKESTVQKILRDLSVRGLVRTGHRRVVVTDLPGLEAFANLAPLPPGNPPAKPY